MNQFGLTEEHLQILKKCIWATLEPHQKVNIWIFGSRARGNYRPFSDVDLLIDATPVFQQKQVADLVEKLEDSNIPFKFDLVVSSDLYPPYAEQIKKEKRLLFSKSAV